jgi:hypothetical protein
MQQHAYGEANVSNVAIELTPEKRAELLPAAKALASALNAVGIVTEIMDNPISGISNTADAVHFLVGEKQ